MKTLATIFAVVVSLFAIAVTASPSKGSYRTSITSLKLCPRLPKRSPKEQLSSAQGKMEACVPSAREITDLPA